MKGNMLNLATLTHLTVSIWIQIIQAILCRVDLPHIQLKMNKECISLFVETNKISSLYIFVYMSPPRMIPFHLV